MKIDFTFISIGPLIVSNYSVIFSHTSYVEADHEKKRFPLCSNASRISCLKDFGELPIKINARFIVVVFGDDDSISQLLM